MNPKPLHPLRLLPALLATPDHGRAHFESQIRQWLASEEGDVDDPVRGTVGGAIGADADTGSASERTPSESTSIPPMGGTIPEAGQ